jgi:hypothetical protein
MKDLHSENILHNCAYAIFLEEFLKFRISTIDKLHSIQLQLVSKNSGN